MNNVMDETAQEIADLKADLTDLQKENARLEKELQEVYDKELSSAPVSTTVMDKTVLDDMQKEIREVSEKLRQRDEQLQKVTAKRDMIQTDLVMALSLIEVIRLNEHDGWTYFTTPQGRERLKWATDRYNKEMETFTHALAKEK